MAGQGGSAIPNNNDLVMYTGGTVVPTVAPPQGVDTVVLSNGDRYDWNGVSWVQVPANDDRVLYTGNTTVPTAVPPKGVDTAVLSNGSRYDWNGTAWVLIPPVVLDGNDRKLLRATATANVAPTVAEIPSPINGDTSTIQLSNGNVEYWNYTAGAWGLVFTIVAGADFVEYTGNNTVPTGVPNKGVDTRVLLNGTRYDWNGTVWVLQPKVPELITYSVSPVVFPSAPTAGDEHFVTSNGTRTGVVLDQYIWDGTVWEKRPQYKDLQRLIQNNGTIKHSLNNEIRWTNRLILMTRGTDALSPNGYHDLNFPTGTIPVQGGAAKAIVAPLANQSGQTGGVLLNLWESLWYKVTAGSSNATNNANYLITTYTSANTNILTDEWVKIASRDDTAKITWFNGDVTEPGMQFGGSLATTMANWTAMKQRGQGEGYYFTPGGNTTIPTAFGFTGTIRWINGGASVSINNNGFVDATQGVKTAGTIVYGVGRANTTWRLMSAAEKPSWFGGATRGNNPIIATSTTVVDLNDNETLFYAPSIDNTGVDTGTWYIVNYSFTSIPAHWLPVASRQSVGTNSTIQVLIGGVQQALRAGDANYMSIGGEGITDRLHRKVTHKGIKHCRWTTNNFFAGTAVNGLLGSPNGLMVNWADNTMIWGISDGYMGWGVQYMFINVPAVGFNIPVTNTNSNITRTVQSVGGLRFVPLGAWEALYFIPPAYAGGGGSADGDFVIGYFNGTHSIPRGAVLIAKLEGGGLFPAGTTTNKNRILFADGTYIQGGSSLATTPATIYDQAHNSGEWRNITVAGGTAAARTSPGNNTPLPAVVGVVGNYGEPYTAQYRNLTLDDDPRGAVEIKGIIELNTNVTAVSPSIAFIPGVSVYGQPIKTVYAVTSTLGDTKLIPVHVRLVNGTFGNQTGFFIRAEVSSLNTAVNPYFTLGVNGGTSPAGNLVWVSLDNIGVVPCA